MNRFLRDGKFLFSAEIVIVFVQAVIEEDIISNLLNDRETPMTRELAEVCRFQFLPWRTDRFAVASRLQTETGFLAKLIIERVELRAT